MLSTHIRLWWWSPWASSGRKHKLCSFRHPTLDCGNCRTDEIRLDVCFGRIIATCPTDALAGFPFGRSNKAEVNAISEGPFRLQEAVDSATEQTVAAADDQASSSPNRADTEIKRKCHGEVAMAGSQENRRHRRRATGGPTRPRPHGRGWGGAGVRGPGEAMPCACQMLWKACPK